jgi:hypothetical protein
MTKFITLVLLLSTAAAAAAQTKSKPWTEWSKKEAEKILNDSPWAKTQVETDTSEMFFRPQADPNQPGVRPEARATLSARDERGGSANQATSVYYHIRFLSARPVRLAFASALTQGHPEFAARAKQFAEARSDDWVVVAVGFESKDERYSNRIAQALDAATGEILKNTTYLERKDGRRVFLRMYGPPTPDGLGAKFIFPRLADGKPFLEPDSGEVRFYSEVGKDITLNMRFKVADMMYEGRLEY